MSTQRRALIVLSHGFLGARVQFLPIAASLVRRYDVLNFGYQSRAHDLSSHADALIDAVKTRLGRKRQVTHFVTHSFGGVVLHRAFAQGLGQIIGDNLEKTRCVLIAPPVRGSSFARAFQKENIGGPEMLKTAVYRTAQAVLGSKSGNQLMMNDEHWFENELGIIPRSIGVLVVIGRTGRLNPLISGESDGVVGVEETMLRREHHRLEIPLTHNLLLYSPKVIQSISEYLAGQSIGKYVAETHETDMVT